MKKILNYTIKENQPLTANVFKMVLIGDSSWISNPGQFMDITIDNAYLKRPISICDWDDNSITIIYKVVGFGTKQLATKKPNDVIECLVGLGNGYDVLNNNQALVVGGGVGVPPLYGLCKELIKKGIKPVVILGFNTTSEVFYENEFKQLGCEVFVSTVDGTQGTKGFVTDVMNNEKLNDMPYYTCGPLPMLKAVFNNSKASGLLSFEERMGCGFGACMGCSCKTITGYKRICKEGPVLKSEEILWTKD